MAKGLHMHLSGMKCTVMIWRSWVQTPASGWTWGALYFCPKLYLNKKYNHFPPHRYLQYIVNYSKASEVKNLFTQSATACSPAGLMQWVITDNVLCMYELCFCCNYPRERERELCEVSSLSHSHTLLSSSPSVTKYNHKTTLFVLEWVLGIPARSEQFCARGECVNEKP